VVTNAETLRDYRVDDPATLTLPRAELERLQDERLRLQVRYAYERSGFWRRKLDEAGASPGDVRGVADLASLPLTTRAELDAEQADHPPFGDYICSPRETWMGVFTTSGTSGRKLKRIVSHRDFRLMVDRFRRHPHPPPGELFMLLGPVDGLLGPTVGVEANRSLGGVPVLAGLWDTRTKVEMIAELRPGVVAGAASYLIHLA
jgi:phenylacetate-CoA ligase